MTSTPDPVQTAVAQLQAGELSGHWVLDPSRSSASFRSRSMWGLVPVKGTFGELSGEATVSTEGNVTGTLAIGAASLDTKNRRRDEHLRSGDFFDTGNYQNIVFSVQEVALVGDSLAVRGTLSVRDVTTPLTITVSAARPSPDEVQLEASTVLDRRAYGMTWNQMGMTSMSNKLTVHAVFTRQ